MRQIPYILMFLASLSFVSCITDDTGGTGEAPESPKTIVFTLSGSSPTAESTRVVTRAIDNPTERETAIGRLDVFFYDATGSLLFYPEASQLAHDTATQRVTITIPEETYTGVLLGRSCTVYLVANTDLTRTQLSGHSLTALNDLLTENGTGALFNLAGGPPENFLMTGSTPATITAEGQNLGKIVLRRAAAKIVVDISNAAVDGYEPGQARVRISNYLDKTRLGTESAVAGLSDYKTSAWKTMTRGGEEETPYSMDSDNAFYSYYNDWSEELDRETYITLELEWYRDGIGSPTVYYYRIPFSYINANDNVGLHKDKIRRNYVYQFMVNVSELGGIDPEDAVDLAANFDVIEWTDQTVDVSILSYHYLFVYNSQMQVHEQPSHEWEYRSSLEIDPIDIVSVECEEYSPDGSSRRVTYNPGDPQYPVITKRQEDGRTYFSASSMVPVNYVPLIIRLRVSNAAQLFSNVSLTIFPKKYVTASFSDPSGYPPSGAYRTPTGTQDSGDWGTNNPNGDGPGDNFNFYRITTTSLDANDEARGIMIGDPTEIVPHPAGANFGNMQYNQTRTDEYSWNVISPEFIVASRRGITTAISWSNARERCARYRESQYAAGTWRVPTFAELAMLGDMQNDPNSAIENLFVPVGTGTNPGWWTARNAYRIQVHLYTYATGNGVEQNGAGAVRCVHDTWRD